MLRKVSKWRQVQLCIQEWIPDITLDKNMCNYLNISYGRFKKRTAKKKKIRGKKDRSKGIKLKQKLRSGRFAKSVIYNNHNYKKIDKLNTIDKFYRFR